MIDKHNIKAKKILLIAGCLILGATSAEAQNIKQDMERQKQQQEQQQQSIKADADRQKRLQAEREEAARRAEQERLKREERKRLGIPEVTVTDLIENASYINQTGYYNNYAEFTEEEKARSMGTWEIESIEYALTLDVYAWNKLKDDLGEYKPPYETELKRKIFEQSDEYKELLNNLKQWRSELLQTVFFAKRNRGDGRFIPIYDLNKRAFIVVIIGQELVERFIFSTLPITQDDDAYLKYFSSNFFLLEMDEKTAGEIEDNKDIQLYVFFMLNGKMATNGWKNIIYCDKVRVVLAHQKTGKIYYDRSFPEGCLPLANQETLSPQEYLAYTAEQQRLAKEIEAAEQQRKIEKIQEEQRKEQEKIEAEKQKEQERILVEKQKRKADLKRWLVIYTFDNETDATMRNLIDDTPSGKGKALIFDKKNRPRSFGTTSFSGEKTISLWIKDCSNGIIWSLTQKPWLNSEQDYTSPYLSYSASTNSIQYVYKGTNSAMNGLSADNSYSNIVFNNCNLNDGKWHLLTLCVVDSHVGPYSYCVRVYLDGSLLGESKPSNDWRMFPNTWNRPTISIGGANMKMDNLRMYSTKLTQEDILDIYEEDKEN